MSIPQSHDLPYASPMPPKPSALRGPLVGGIILFVGLGLIGLGGCFLAGILMMLQQEGTVHGKTITFGFAAYLLMAVLYLMAFGCFGGAIALFYAGLRALARG